MGVPEELLRGLCSRGPDKGGRGSCEPTANVGLCGTNRIVVGTGRFELPTPRTPSECSTRLSHVPTAGKPLANRAAGVVFKILHQPPLSRRGTRSLYLRFRFAACWSCSSTIAN